MRSLRQQNPLASTDEYILGNTNPRSDHVLHLGRFYALDGSLGASVSLDVSKPHVTLIAGKRGYGKSYTMGVFLEEFNRLSPSVKPFYSCIVIDTLGIFWTLTYPNTKQKNLLSTWNLNPEETPISLLHTTNDNSSVFSDITRCNRLQIPASLLTAEQWCHLFQLSSNQPEAILLTRAILQLKSQSKQYSISDIKETLYQIPNMKKEYIQHVENLLIESESWHLFTRSFDFFSSLIQPGEITIVDLSFLNSTHLKQIITGIIAELLFYKRINQRKKEEFQKIKGWKQKETDPFIWLAIDEAHLFLPENQDSYVKEILLHNWLRQGRQPGLSILMATQRPSFMDQEVLSHSDLVLCHRLTAEEDIQSLTQLRPTYMKEDMKQTIKQIGTEKGVALIIDDVVETSHVIKIRPRYSWHGGGEPTPSTINEECIE